MFLFRFALVVCSVFVASACAPPPEPKTAKNEDTEEVPANSGTDPDAQAAADKKQKEGPKEAPTEPLTTPIAGGGEEDGPAATPSTGAKKKPSKSGPRATKKQCNAAFDKYLDLAIGSDARLAGVTPELIKQAKDQARGMKGDPCASEPPSKSQYDCAMGATSTAEWEACMK